MNRTAAQQRLGPLRGLHFRGSFDVVHHARARLLRWLLRRNQPVGRKWLRLSNRQLDCDDRLLLRFGNEIDGSVVGHRNPMGDA